MKKIFSLLLTATLLTATTSVAVSCSWSKQPKNTVWDQNYKEIEGGNPDSKQVSDLNSFKFLVLMLQTKHFTDENNFRTVFDKQDGNTVADKLFNDGQESADNEKAFNYDFKFVISQEKYLNKNSIESIRTTQLTEQEPTNYLVVNLPKVDLNNLPDEYLIDFQLMFIFKDANGKITGNDQNENFYWVDWLVLNDPNPADPITRIDYFLNIKKTNTTYRVITNYVQP